MEQIRQLEHDRLRQLAEEYNEKGYETILEPGPDQLPDFLQSFRPDLIVRKDDEATVIEVKSRRSLSQNPQIREMARLVQGRKGWNFELILMGGGAETQLLDGAEPYEEADILSKMEDAKKLAHSKFPDAALLYAWSAAEAALRLTADREDMEIKPLKPLHTIKTLTMEGIRSRNDYQFLTTAKKIRNAVVHGYKSKELNPDIVQRLITFTEKAVSCKL